MVREMRLPASWPLEQLVALAKRADEAGLDRLWCIDCLPQADAFVVLAALACATSRIQLGAAGLDPASRHPVVALGAALTLDELSHGRAFLAFSGSGEAVKEALALARLAASGGRMFEGRFFRLDNATYAWGRRDLEVLAEPPGLPSPMSPEDAFRTLAA